MHVGSVRGWNCACGECEVVELCIECEEVGIYCICGGYMMYDMDCV